MHSADTSAMLRLTIPCYLGVFQNDDTLRRSLFRGSSWRRCREHWPGNALLSFLSLFCFQNFSAKWKWGRQKKMLPKNVGLIFFRRWNAKEFDTYMLVENRRDRLNFRQLEKRRCLEKNLVDYQLLVAYRTMYRVTTTESENEHWKICVASSCATVGSHKESRSSEPRGWSHEKQIDANGSNLSSTQLHPWLHHHIGGFYIDSLCIGLLIIILSILNRIGTI